MATSKTDTLNAWKKHTETKDCPEALDAWIEVETWAAKGSYIELAGNLDWQYVKFYRVVPEKK